MTGLIGCGAKGEAQAVVSTLRKRGVKRLDTFILNTWAEESIGGLPEFLRSFPVRRVVQNPMNVPTPVATRAIASMSGMGDRLAASGATMDSSALFFSPPCSVRNVGPIGAMYHQFPKDPECSMVVEFTYSKFTFLSLGDTRQKHQKALWKAADPDPLGQVLQISGRGGKDALMPSLLRPLGTLYVVIPVPTKSKTKPAPELLRMLRQSKIRVLRTDTNGSITITSDGRNTSVATER